MGAAEKKYVAYVGSYTYTGKAQGITLFDVDVEQGRFFKRDEIAVNNSSYLALDPTGKYLYSVVDEGVLSFAIEEGGSLRKINTARINGMRGCHLSIDDEHIYVSGFHDGKVSVLARRADGGAGRLVAEVFHKGVGSVSERNFRPHVTCTGRTMDGKYVLAADSGLDQVRIYSSKFKNQEMRLLDAIRCELESAPRRFLFSPDGRFIYIITEQKNTIEVYTYTDGERVPEFDRVQTITALSARKRIGSSATVSLKATADMKYLFCGNAGSETVSIYSRDEETGMLTQLGSVPVSGEYPKDIALFPDDKHLVSVNHESGTLTFFKIDYQAGLLIMCARDIPCSLPNCCVFAEV